MFKTVSFLIRLSVTFSEMFLYFQIHKVQQRVTIKKALTLKYGEELARAKAVASKEIGKRKLEQDRLGVSWRYFWKAGFYTSEAQTVYIK